MELGEHLDSFFQCQLLKIAVTMAAWVTALQKNKFGTKMLGLLNPKITLTLC